MQRLGVLPSSQLIHYAIDAIASLRRRSNPLASPQAVRGRSARTPGHFRLDVLTDREVLPQAMQLNPAFFKIIYTDLLNIKKTAKTVAAALSAIDAYLAGHAPEGPGRDAPAQARADWWRMNADFLFFDEAGATGGISIRWPRRAVCRPPDRGDRRGSADEVGGSPSVSAKRANQRPMLLVTKTTPGRGQFGRVGSACGNSA